MSVAEFHRNLRAKGKGAKDWANSWTEVEYLDGGKFAATLYAKPKVFKGKTDSKWKKHKLTDNRPDHVLVQSANCCVEVHPYYAKYYDPNHEEVRLHEERWVVQRLFKTVPKEDWRDVDVYNPRMSVEETANGITATVTYDTDYGSLIVRYIQRDGRPLKHEVTFTNTSGETETFRVLQRWAGIVGAKCNGKDIPLSIEDIREVGFLRFHRADKLAREFNIAENLWSIIYNSDRTEKMDQCLQRPVNIETYVRTTQGLKADFIFGNWTLKQGESLTIDPDTYTATPPTDDTFVWEYYPDTNYGSDANLYVRSHEDDDIRLFVEFDLSSIPAGATIDVATLRLYCTDYDAGRIFEINRVTESWSEDTATWNYQPSVTITNEVEVDSPESTGWWETSVTAQVQDAWNIGTTYSCRIKDRSEDNPTAKSSTFDSKEGTNDPQLYVEYSVGWTGKISGVVNPAKVMGIDVTNIAKVKGVA